MRRSLGGRCARCCPSFIPLIPTHSIVCHVVLPYIQLCRVNTRVVKSTLPEASPNSPSAKTQSVPSAFRSCSSDLDSQSSVEYSRTNHGHLYHLRNTSKHHHNARPPRQEVPGAHWYAVLILPTSTPAPHPPRPNGGRRKHRH